jgi:hypothetical protein
MNVQIAITGFSPVDDPATLKVLRAAVSQLAAAAERVGYPLRVYVSPEEETSQAQATPPIVTSPEPTPAAPKTPAPAKPQAP